MFGLVGLMPDYAMIVVGANMGVSKMTREHLGICLALQVPIFIVVTKVDIAPEQVYDDTKKVIEKICLSPQVMKQPHFIKEDTDLTLLT
jgi:elongation factor 1-alpha